MNQKGICTKSAAPIQRTVALQQRWGFPTPETPIIRLHDLRGCYEQINAELMELAEIIDDFTEMTTEELITEVSDVAIDLLEYVQQMIVRTGMVQKVEEDSYKIYLNNCTKVCDSYKEAVETQEMYDDAGIETYIDYVQQFNLYVVKNCETSHVVKPKGFVPVQL